MGVSQFNAVSYKGRYSNYINEVNAIGNNFGNWSAQNNIGQRGALNSNPNLSARDRRIAGVELSLASSAAARGENQDENIFGPNTKGIDRRDLPFDTDKMLREYENAAQAAQKDPANPTGKAPGILQRVFDVFSRPTYANASAFNVTVDEAKADGKGVSLRESLNIATYAIPGVNLIRGAIDSLDGDNKAAEAFVEGLRGKRKTFFSDVLLNAHPDMNRKAVGAVGLTLDIITDPLTFATGGTSAAGRGGLSIAGKTIVKGKNLKAQEALSARGKLLGTDAAKALKDSGEAESVKLKAIKELNAGGNQTEAFNISELDLADPDAMNSIINSLFNRSTTRGAKEGQADVKSALVTLKAIMGAMNEPLENAAYKQIYDQAIESAVKSGKYTPVEVLDDMGRKAFVLEYAKPQDIALYDRLKTKRAALDQRIKRQGDRASASLKAERDRVARKIEDMQVGSNSPSRFTIDIDAEGTMSSFIKNNIMTNPEFARLEKLRNRQLRRFIKPGDKTGATRTTKYKNAVKEYERISAMQADIVGEIMVRELGLSSGNAAAMSKSAKAMSDKKLVTKRVELTDKIESMDKQLKALVRTPEYRSKRRSDRRAKDSRHGRDTAARRMTAALERDLADAKRQKSVLNTEIGHRMNQTSFNMGAEGAARQTRTAEKFRSEAAAQGDTRLIERMDAGALKIADRTDPDELAIMIRQSVSPWDKKHQRATASNTSVEAAAKTAAEEGAARLGAEHSANAVEFMAKVADSHSSRQFSVNVGWGKNKMQLMSFKTPGLVDAALKVAMSNNTIQSSVTKFRTAFVSSHRFGPELKNIQVTQSTLGQSIIEYKLASLQKIFSGVPVGERKNLMKEFILKSKGGGLLSGQDNLEAMNALDNLFGDIAASLTRNSDEALKANPALKDITLEDIASFMPKGLKLDRTKNLEGSGLEPGSLAYLIKALDVNDLDSVDPAKLLYHTTIATEQARMTNAINTEIVSMFGFRRGLDDAGEVLKDDQIFNLLSQKGYRAVTGLDRQGKGLIFTPEIASQIDKLHDILKSPIAQSDFTRFFDSAQGVWKKWVTVFNPGFQARSAMGDGFVAYLNGVSGPGGLKSYGMSGKVLKAFNRINQLPEGSFASPRIFENSMKSVDTSATIFKMSNGEAVTAQQVWALYVNYVGKLGFTSTEFQHLNPTKGITSNIAARGATRLGDKVTDINQGREDFFRLGHFIHLIRNDKNLKINTLEKIAQNAGQQVRKFHIDYTDFTNFEKTKLARVAPFYKWTRKALPLMMENILTNPAKVNNFNKVMYNLSISQGFSSDTTGNAQGFKVAGSDAIVPEWMSSRPFAPLMGNDGNTVMWGPAVPFNDAISTMTSAAGIKGMVSPAVGLAIGQTGAASNRSITQQVAGLLPIPNYLVNQRLAKDKPMFDPTDPAFVNVLSGLGIQENTGERQQSDIKYRTKMLRESQKDWRGKVQKVVSPQGAGQASQGSGGSPGPVNVVGN